MKADLQICNSTAAVGTYCERFFHLGISYHCHPQLIFSRNGYIYLKTAIVIGNSIKRRINNSHGGKWNRLLTG